jgi:TetR/AcrR family transcriptional repressor of bet genes
LGRTASKDRRRVELIEATITAIAKNGLVGTRMADVAEAAGVSYGVVSFYFKSKDALLLATLTHLAEEYEAEVTRALARAGDMPAAKLGAIVETDFSATVAEPRKIAAWTAFWSESRSQRRFQKRCVELEDAYYDVTYELCREIAEAGNYKDIDPAAVAIALNSLVNGLWVEMQIRGNVFTRAQGKRACWALLAACFPREFLPRVHSAA